MRPVGLALILVCLAVPFAFFPQLAAMHDSGAVFSQLLGSSALVGMALAQVLATRWHGLEMIFGGLDRIYVQHKWLGIGSLAAILLHDTIDADVPLAALGLARETLLNGLGETLGEISLYGLLALALVTVLTFVPYRLWRWTHKLMGGFFAFGALHFALVAKPIANSDPLGLYVLGFCAAGTAAWLYTLLPFAMVQARERYRVTTLAHDVGAVSVSLAPVDRGIVHQAGQFAFFGFGSGLNGETHPFTIAQAPRDDRALRIVFKPLGDHTRSLSRTLKAGDEVRVSRSFGHFRRPRPTKPQIWIAGGIGITPFLAWAETLSKDDAPVHLFYCVRSETEATHLVELQARWARLPNARLHLIESSQTRRLTGDRIAEMTGADLRRAEVAFCGPKAMGKDLRDGLIRLGLPRRRFMYEEFEIRSGLGVRRAVGWLIGRFGSTVARTGIGGAVAR